MRQKLELEKMCFDHFGDSLRFVFLFFYSTPDSILLSSYIEPKEARACSNDYITKFHYKIEN